MNWYNRISLASVRDDKKAEALQLIEELDKVMEGCEIDKLSSEDAVDAMLKRMDRKKTRFLISDEMLLYLIEALEQAKSVIRDSPTEFAEIIHDAMITLDEYLYELELKG
jgi:hypothetical protein